MILLGYDIETTGLDKHKDRMTEVGLALYSTGQRRILESTGFLVQTEGVQIPAEVVEKTGITQAAVDRFGYAPADAFADIERFMMEADAIATHNGKRFDIPFTQNAAKRLGCVLPDKLVIDTMHDIPGVEGEQLITMCAKHGFVSQNQHSAVHDAMDVIKLMSFYNFDAIIERAKSPLVVVLSHQDRNNNADAKKFKFRWNPERKIWWKAVKETDVVGLANQVPFTISVAEKDVSLEQLWD